MLKLRLVRQRDSASQAALWELRTKLVQAIDPLQAPGADLQDVLLRCNRMASGELADGLSK